MQGLSAMPRARARVIPPDRLWAAHRTGRLPPRPARLLAYLERHAGQWCEAEACRVAAGAQSLESLRQHVHKVRNWLAERDDARALESTVGAYRLVRASRPASPGSPA